MAKSVQIGPENTVVTHRPQHIALYKMVSKLSWAAAVGNQLSTSSLVSAHGWVWQLAWESTQ